MNITVNAPLFAQEIRRLNKITPSKPVLPILGHVLVQTTTDSLQLYATDLELWLHTRCKAHIEAPGEVALPTARLLALFEHFVNVDVALEVKDKHVHIATGTFQSRMQALPTDDFPSLPPTDGTAITLPAHGFRELMGYTRYAVPETSVKYAMQGALLTCAGPIAAMVATDGKRLALVTMNRPAGADVQVIVPVKTLDILATLTDAEAITVTIGERHLFFDMGDQLVVSRMLEGQFPAYQRIIPKDCDRKAVIDRNVLMPALRRVGLVTEEDHATTFEFSATGLGLSAASIGVGDAMEQVPIEYTGEPLTVQANWKFVLDFLEVAKSPTVTLELKDAYGAMLLTDGENHLAVIMLMRTT